MRPLVVAAAALLIASCGARERTANGSAEVNASAAPATPATQGGEGGAAAIAALTPGEYETTIEVLRIDMTGGPALPAGVIPPVPPPTTIRSCLTPDQARRPDANFLTGSGAQAGCVYDNLAMDGGRIVGAATCDAQGTRVRTVMDGQFSSVGYTMSSQSRIQTNGMTIETDSRITSRRIGDCPGR
jgi:hypothetical protein